MNKTGFLLIECSLALILLAGLTSTYAWYLCQSMALQATAANRLWYTTALSNHIEELYADAKHVYRSDITLDSSCVLVQSWVCTPPITGAWSSNALNEKIGYRLVKLSTTWRNEMGKEEQCAWYAGLLI